MSDGNLILIASLVGVFLSIGIDLCSIENLGDENVRNVFWKLFRFFVFF